MRKFIKNTCLILLAIVAYNTSYSQELHYFKYKKSTVSGKNAVFISSNNKLVHDDKTAFIYNLDDDVYIGTFFYRNSMLSDTQELLYVYESISKDLLVVSISGKYALLLQSKVANESEWRIHTVYSNVRL